MALFSVIEASRYQNSSESGPDFAKEVGLFSQLWHKGRTF
jgi:hypothetical protein